VVVTGGAGFIGSNLVDALIELGATVKVIDDLSNGRLENINKEARFVRSNICDEKAMKKCLADSDLVFHLAANTTTRETSMGWSNPYEEMRVNIEGSINILKTVIDSKLSTKVIFASSAAVYGEPKYTPVDEKHPLEPVSPYGISKLAAERYALASFKEFGVNAIAARIFNTYGPRQSRYVIHDLIKKLMNNQNQLEILGNGSNIRDYAYVSDTVAALILLAERGKSGEVYNIAGGNPIAIRDLATLILRELNLLGKTKVNYTGSSWKGDISKMMANISKIEILGFKPEVSLEVGIKKTANWFLRYNKT
jgi:UDP-glucose 4-epimerase